MSGKRKTGFTGTRWGMTDEQKAVLEGLLGPLTEFHHGGCQGADVEAARIVRRVFGDKVWIVCHPGPEDDGHQEDSGVDDERRAPRTHFARNRTIVDGTDEMIACPCDMEEQARGGTWYTVGYARKKGKRLTIVWPNGGLG